MPCFAQIGYTISGSVRGITTDKVYIVSNIGRPDTLGVTGVTNGNFVFTGKVDDGVCAVKIVFGGVEEEVPVLLENKMYRIQVSQDGVSISGGGEATKLYGEFNRVVREYATVQEAVMAEFNATGNDASQATALQSRIDVAYKASVQKTLDLIKANPGSYVSAYVIATGIRSDSEELLREKYGLLNDAARSTVPGKEIEAALAAYDKVAVGQPAPDFTVKRPNGDELSLSGIPAKIKLLVFWASWDAASREANPEFIRLYLQYRPKSFEIVSLSLDDNRFAWDRAIEQDGISIWSNGSDLQGTDSPVAKTYMVGSSLPYTVLIDEENKIVAKGLLGDELRKTVADLVKRKRK